VKIKIIALFSLFLISGLAQAGKVNCFGFKDDHYIKVEIWIPGITALDDTNGKIYIDEDEITRFETGDVNVSLIRKSFKAKNQRGDYLEGKVNSLTKKEAIIYQLKIPNYRISFQNFTVKC